jgi:hypothetical protein
MLVRELCTPSAVRESIWNMELTVANLHKVSDGVQSCLLVCNRAKDL